LGVDRELAGWRRSRRRCVQRRLHERMSLEAVGDKNNSVVEPA
jgi:hypothetical protein